MPPITIVASEAELVLLISSMIPGAEVELELELFSEVPPSLESVDAAVGVTELLEGEADEGSPLLRARAVNV